MAAVLALLMTGGIAVLLWALYEYKLYSNTEVMTLAFCIGGTLGCAMIIGSACCFVKACQCRCGRKSPDNDNEHINLLRK